MAKEYRVTWEIDVAAGSARGAAKVARSILRDPDGWASVFTVTEEDCNPVTVDLDICDGEDQ